MMRSLVFCALTLLPLAAFATSLAGTSAGASSAGSSDSSSSGDDKVVADAREDAAGFVASDGAIRGARLEAALLQLRSRNDAERLSSDLQLAQSILAQ